MLRQAFHSALLALQDDLYQMGEVVTHQLEKTKQAFHDQDRELARLVIEMDQDLNAQEVSLEEKSLELIALQQPVSTDLRQVIAVLKASSDVERMGDHLRAISQSIIRLSVTAPIEALGDPMDALFLSVGKLVSQSFTVYRQQDADKAIFTAHLDEEVDRLYQLALNQLTDHLNQCPEQIEAGKDYLQILLHLERLGDYAKNICEWVVYLTQGEMVHF